MKANSFLQPLSQAVQDRRVENGVHAVAVLFLVLSLWLPPFSAGVRIWHTDYPLIAQTGGAVSTEDGAQLLIPEGAVSKQLRLKMTAMSAVGFLSGDGDEAMDLAAEAINGQAVTLLGNLYRFIVRGSLPQTATLAIPLPKDTVASADVYAWDGKTWEWQPAHAIAEQGVLEAHLDTVPMLAVAAQSKRQSPAIATAFSGEPVVPKQAAGILSELDVEGFYLSADGTIAGAPDENHAKIQGYPAVPLVSNRKDGQVQPAVLKSILADAQTRGVTVQSLTKLAVENMYPGVQLDFQGLDASLGDAYVAFVTEAAGALHQQGKWLAVRVPAPKQVAEDRWDTGAYDWQSLGQVVDALVIPAIESPAAFAPGGAMESLLQWAVGQVNRTKLQVALSVHSYRVVGQEIIRVPYLQALAELGQLAVEGDKQLVSPGEEVALSLPSLQRSGGLRYDAEIATYLASYTDEQGTEHQIWLENATSLAYKLKMILNYNIRGVVLEDLLDAQNDARIWDLLQHFKELTVPAVDSDFIVVWTVQGPGGEQERVVASLREGQGAGPSSVSVAAAAQGSSGPQYVWQAPDSPGEYSIAASISDDGGQTVQVQSNSIDLQIPTPTPTPTPTATPTPTLTPTPKPTAKPAAPAAPPPSRGPSFAYGIQGDALTDGDHGRIFGLIQQTGFGWFKQQVEWFRYHPAPGQYDWAPLDRIVNSASPAGLKVLFSVVKAPQWARPAGDTDQGPPSDPNVYGEFLRAMAEHFKGRVQAYEIWNEQNLYYEWGGLGGKLNAGKYVALLKVAYQAIKAADPSATVISGALTPTGYNDGNIAIDDRVYLEQMYQAGLKNYCDAVGAHPSGYNNPPDGEWQTYQDPSASFNAKGHPSWFFRGTMESYRNIMVKYGDSSKRIWVTEFGWAAVEGLGAAPARGYEYSADNTEAEQAQFIVRAYEMAKGWGWVGPMFLWNLNFGPICGSQDEKSAFGIIRPDWSMRPAFAALANMPK